MLLKNRTIFFSPDAPAGDPPVVEPVVESVPDPPAQKPVKGRKPPKSDETETAPDATDPAVALAEAKIAAYAEKVAGLQSGNEALRAEADQYRAFALTTAQAKRAAAPEFVKKRVTSIDQQNPMATIARIDELTQAYEEIRAEVEPSKSAPPPAPDPPRMRPATINDAPIPQPRLRYKK